MSVRSKGKRRPGPLQSIPRSTGMVGRRVAAIDLSQSFQALKIDNDLTPRAIAPTLVMTPPQDVSEISDTHASRRPSETMISRAGAKLSRAATAPAGALQLCPTVAQPLRRAISARMSDPGQRGGRNQESQQRNALLPRISRFGSPASRSIITRRKICGNVSPRREMKLKTDVRGRAGSFKLNRNELILTTLQERRKDYFSDTSSSKDITSRSNVGLLETNIIDFKERDLPDTPTSLLSTPRELYPQTGHALDPSLVRHHTTSTKVLGQRPLSVVGKRHFSLTSTPDNVRSSVPKRLFQTVHSPESSKLQVYIPGHIRLDDTPMTAHCGAQLETHGTGCMFSDDEALDGIVAYFEQFGLWDAATEDVLDKFWEAEPDAEPIPLPRKTESKASIWLGLDEPPRRRPRPPHILLPSKSEPHCWSERAIRLQQEKPAAPEARNRSQRIKLRRFLTSATSIL